MKTIIKKTLLAGAVLAAGIPAVAQNVNSGYFMDYYTYRHQLNPAFAGFEKGYVGFPALGNINVGAHGNIHTSSIFYNRNGKTMLFTNPLIGVDEAMKGFKDRNRLGAGVKLGVIDFGFKAFGGYNTVGINVVASADVVVPGSLFSLLKEGVSNTTYDISDVRADAVGYAEIALNHSRDIKWVPGLRAGITAKFLVGVAALQAKMNKAYLELGTDSWNAVTDAEIYTSLKGMHYKTDYNDNMHRDYVSGIDVDKFKAPNGFGFAIDLGAEYQWKDWTFSAAFLDLGAIRFSETYLATTNGPQEVRTDRYTFEVSGDNSQEEWDNFGDNVSELYQMSDEGNIGGHSYTLKATMNLAAAYTLPMYKKVKFGLLSTTRFNGRMTATEFRLSANYQPAKAIGLNINGAVGTYGWGFGWMANVHVTGFNLFLGMDHVPGKLMKQGVPLNSNADVFLGINFPF